MTTAAIAVLTLAVAAAVPKGAPAEEGSPLPVGSRILVLATRGPERAGYSLRGRLLSLEPEGLTVFAEETGGPVRLGPSEVLRLQQPAGRKRARGAGIGAAVGAAIGLALTAGFVAWLNAHTESDTACEGAGGCLAEIAYVGAPVAATGALVGAVVGLSHAPERWQDAGLPWPTPGAQLRGTGFGIRAARGGVARVELRFGF